MNRPLSRPLVVWLTALAVAAGEIQPPMQVVLNSLTMVRIPVSRERLTTIRFPGPISDLDGLNFAAEDTPGALFHITHRLGAELFSVRSLRTNAAGNLNIGYREKTYVLEIVDSETPVLAVTFSTTKVVDPVNPPPSSVYMRVHASEPAVVPAPPPAPPPAPTPVSVRDFEPTPPPPAPAITPPTPPPRQPPPPPAPVAVTPAVENPPPAAAPRSTRQRSIFARTPELDWNELFRKASSLSNSLPGVAQLYRFGEEQEQEPVRVKLYTATHFYAERVVVLNLRITNDHWWRFKLDGDTFGISFNKFGGNAVSRGADVLGRHSSGYFRIGIRVPPEYNDAPIGNRISISVPGTKSTFVWNFTLNP